ncbi:MAG TPA: amidase [Chloroflexota bacterium]|nr:amidase [Chloroflexota bacterium]
MSTPHDPTISEAGGLIAARSLSALELVEDILAQIERTEPLVHAYALILPEQARAEARRLDRELGAGMSRGPLHGIPIAVKDLCYMKDLPTEAGSRALAGFVPTYDATVVERLRAAGAVIVGKTVTHEFAYGVNVPPTRNAWDHERYPGGSSAGSAVAVAMRSAFGAIGTDTGGSIREPASLNGLVGLKPTFGLVSRYGIVPLSPSLDHAGPITRSVQDCALLLQALAGYDGRDSGSITVPPVDYTANLGEGIDGLTIGVERGFSFGGGVWDGVRESVERVLAEMEDWGARIVEVEMPSLDLMTPVGMTILLSDASAYHRRSLRERGADLDPATRLMFELGELVPATHYVTALRARAVLRNQMRALFATHRLDALLSPTVPTTAVLMHEVSPVDQSDEDPMTGALRHMIAANLTGQPALTVPCGFSAGLPVGFQLLGRPFGEVTLFRLAAAYESCHSWHTMAPEAR